MNLEKLEQSVRDIVDDLDRDEFIYQLLLAYGQPKASITRLKNGQYNQSKKRWRSAVEEEALLSN